MIVGEGWDRALGFMNVDETGNLDEIKTNVPRIGFEPMTLRSLLPE